MIVVTTHDSLNPIYGGGAYRSLLVAKEFLKRNFKVVLVGPSLTDNIDGIAVIQIPAPRKVRSQILSAIKFNLRLLFKLLKIIKNVEKIFVHNTIALPAPLLVSILFQKQLILDITDIHAEYLKIGKINFLEVFFRPFLIWLEYFMISIPKKVIVVTEQMKKQIIKYNSNPHKIKVIYDGVDGESFITTKQQNYYFNLIHLGLIDKQHGVELLIKALPKIIQKISQVKVYIVGGGRELENIKKLSKILNVGKNCIFTGFLPMQQAREYLQKASIGVITRPDSLPNHLVITLKLLEYWASGTIVVSSRLRGIEEVATESENIIFFNPSDHNDLSDKIIQLLQNKDKIDLLRKKSVETAKKFLWSKIIPEIVDVCFTD